MRVYSITFDNLTLPNAACTIAALRPASTVGIELLEVRLGFSANATSAQQRVQIVSQVISGSPSGWTGKTPAPLDGSLTQVSALVSGTSMGAGTACVQAGSSVEASGARTVLVADAFNHLTGWPWVPGPQTGIYLPAGSSSAICIYAPSAVATLNGWSGTMTFGER